MVFTIQPKNQTRLDTALLEYFRTRGIAITRKQLKQLFHEGRIHFASRPAAASLTLSAGEYSINIQDWTAETLSLRPSQRGCFLPVLYEDENFLILHKTVGVPSTPISATETETATNAALARCPEAQALHRLDTMVSGCLAFAKNSHTYDRLKRLWKTPEVKKIYRAIVEKSESPQTPLAIDMPIARSTQTAKKVFVVREEHTISKRQMRGKPLPALTRITNAQTLGTRTDLTVEIETGVMHQIRCHLSEVIAPILGDKKYGGSPSSRIWLHAWKLSLPLESGKKITVISELPEDWPTRSTD